jgi:hypothetical protein
MASIFTSQTPVVGDANDSTAYTMGTRFTPAVDGQITHIRWFYPTGAQPGGAPVKATLFRNLDSAQLATAVDMPNPGVPGAWNQVALGSPVNVASGVEYTAAILTPGHYVATNSYPWPVVNGDLSTPSVGAGRFEAGSSFTFPTNNANGNYFVDVVFTTGSAEAEGSVSADLALALAVTGRANHSAVADPGLGLAVAASGTTPAQGVVALGLGLAPVAGGQRASEGTVDAGLGLAVAGSGVSGAHQGQVAVTLGLAVSARGSNGDSGRPVRTWPFSQDDLESPPWTPRPVKSFQEVNTP